jgi:hypothetical protein
VGIELAGASPPKFAAENYPDYPLIILSDGGKKKIARVTADEKGNYRIAQPPGDYILDVQGRGRKHVRAKPQPFTVVSNQTVHVDMDMDTGIRQRLLVRQFSCLRLRARCGLTRRVIAAIFRAPQL